MEVTKMLLTKRHNFKALFILSFMVLPLLMILPQTSHADTSLLQGTVNTSKLNVREDAAILSNIIGLVHQGDTFSIIQRKNNWDQIELSSSETGWVHDAFITTTEKNVEAKVEAVILNVRENPTLSSKVVGKLKLGTTITVREEQAGWANIVSPLGVQGWVNKAYITKQTSTGQPAQQVQQVQQAELVTNVPTEVMPNSLEPLNGKTIVLDPGHGGIDGGTTSIVGTPEKTLTLETAQVVEQKLKNAGANVMMTRSDDTYISLPQRADVANKNNADAFISFHYNWANDTSVNGLTDFYYHKTKDESLASDILSELAKTTSLKNIGTRFNDLSVLRNNLQPSTLIELGFVSNKQEDSVVESQAFRDNVALGVYLGLLDYFSKNSN